MAATKAPVAQLKAMLTELAAAREQAAGLKARLDQANAVWLRRNAALLDELKAAAGAVCTLEGEVRERALWIYVVLGGEKHPAPGVDVRVLQRVEYEPEQAFAWAVDNGLALRLDPRAFEALAKTSPLESLAEIAKVVDQPQAIIATDLTKVLAATGDDPQAKRELQRRATSAKRRATAA